MNKVHDFYCYTNNVVEGGFCSIHCLNPFSYAYREQSGEVRGSILYAYFHGRGLEAKYPSIADVQLKNTVMEGI